MSPGGLDTTGRPVDPARSAPARPEARTPPRDPSSPLFAEEEFSGKVVRPEQGAQSGSAVESIDFADAVSDGEADIETVVRDSRVYEVLDELDAEFVALAPVKERIRDIAAL